MAVWTLVGNKENWRTAFRQNGIWGVKERFRKLWERLEPEDHLVFYCKHPVSGVIGVGTLAKTFKQDSPLWPDEERAGRVIYPYRLEMNIRYTLPQPEWQTHCIKGSFVGLSRGHVAKGLNPLINEEVLSHLDKALQDRFGVSFSPIEEEPELDHAGVQKMLLEIGSLQRFLSHKEYPMENQRLDVVWRRVEGSVPTYVFEIQVGGDLQHAIGKLKHAYDKWNSNIVLALRPEDVPKAESLLSGTFHEIRGKTKLAELSKVLELYRLKKQLRSLEKDFGIIT